MDCKFYVGQKIVCVNDHPGEFLNSGFKGFVEPGLDGLQAGKIYTVKSMYRYTGIACTTKVSVILEEITRPGGREGAGVGFDCRRFRPLDEVRKEVQKSVKRKTDISIFQDMCKKTYSDAEIAELLKDDEKV